MKRFFSILLIVLTLTLFLTSCGEPPTVNSDFLAVFTTTYQNEDYAGTIKKDGDHLTIAMTSPYTVQGLIFEYQGDALSIRRGDHSANSKTEYLPDNSIPAVLRNTLVYLPQATFSKTEDGADIFDLPTPYGDATVTALNGIPTTLTDPHSGLEIKFTG